MWMNDLARRVGPTALALAVSAVAAPGARAADEEIQVYMDEIGPVGAVGLDLHLNYVPAGRTLPDYPGGQVSEGRFRLTLRKDLKFDYPRAETPDHYMTMAMDPDLDQCVVKALRDMIVLLGEIRNLSREDAYTLCSLAADLRVTQTVNGSKGIHCMIATANPKPASVAAASAPQWPRNLPATSWPRESG
mgnify:CR=1 FL=1